MGGCVYLPETTVRYDEKCGVYERKMTMQPYQMGTLMGCRDDGCVKALVLVGAVSAASAVVSGSVVVVKNVAYWLEKQGHCPTPAPTPIPNPAPKPDSSGAAPAR